MKKMASYMRTKVLVTQLLGLNIPSLQHASRSISFWRRKKEESMDNEDTRKLTEFDGLTFLDRTQSLKKRTSVQTKRPYKPTADTEEKLAKIVEEVYGDNEDWKNIPLQDRHKKYRLLTKSMKAFDHFVPNMDLQDMNSVGDVLTFFKTEVRDTTTLEDLSKLDLPKNLHINTEYLRYDPSRTDNLFGGKDAFPGRQTVVSSQKFKRKYKAPIKSKE